VFISPLCGADLIPNILVRVVKAPDSDFVGADGQAQAWTIAPAFESIVAYDPSSCQETASLPLGSWTGDDPDDPRDRSGFRTLSPYGAWQLSFSAPPAAMSRVHEVHLEFELAYLNVSAMHARAISSAATSLDLFSGGGWRFLPRVHTPADAAALKAFRCRTPSTGDCEAITKVPTAAGWGGGVVAPSVPDVADTPCEPGSVWGKCSCASTGLFGEYRCDESGRFGLCDCRRSVLEFSDATEARPVPEVSGWTRAALIVTLVLTSACVAFCCCVVHFAGDATDASLFDQSTTPTQRAADTHAAEISRKLKILRKVSLE
jgi:hypothetical protein